MENTTVGMKRKKYFAGAINAVSMFCLALPSVLFDLVIKMNEDSFSFYPLIPSLSRENFRPRRPYLSLRIRSSGALLQDCAAVFQRRFLNPLGTQITIRFS